MVLRNYVILTPGIPARVHFVEHAIVPRTITDPSTSRPKVINALVFTVDELNGAPVSAQYSTVSEKHAAQFSAYLAGDIYKNYDFTITQQGEGFRTSWTVLATPHGK